MVQTEVLDARIPLSSLYGNIKSLLGEKPRLILLNKADLTPENELKNWVKKLEEISGTPLPKAVSELFDAPVLHDTVVPAAEMQSAVERYLALD